MEPELPPAPTPGADPVASVALEPGIHLLADGGAEVVGVAVLAAGRLGAELDTAVAVVQREAPSGHPAGADDGVDLSTAADRSTGPSTIRLRLADPATLGLPVAEDLRGQGHDLGRRHDHGQERRQDQGYVLTVTRDLVDLAAPTPTGLTHAVATLVRMASVGRTRADRIARRAPRLTLGTVHDQPWLPWRGLAVDLVDEPLGVDGLRVLLSLMSALRLGVLRLPALEAAALGDAGYAEVSAAAAACRVRLVPGVATPPWATSGEGTSTMSVDELVASTRAHRVDIGGRTGEPDEIRRTAETARAAGAGVVADQAAADALTGLPDVVLVVRDVGATDDVAAVRRAVAAGARVVLAVPRRPSEQPLLDAAVAVDRAAAVLDLPAAALIGVEAVPAPYAAPDPAPDSTPDAVADSMPASGSLDPYGEGSRAGVLLPWMTAIAEVGWTPPA